LYDAAIFYGAKAEHWSRILKQFCLAPKNYVLATIHRAENTDDSRRLRVVFQAPTARGQGDTGYFTGTPKNPNSSSKIQNSNTWPEAY